MFWKPKKKEEEGKNLGFGAKEIRAWAEDVENTERAKELGTRIFQFGMANDTKGLLDAESLGEFEDKVTQWAVEHPGEAKLLMIELATKLLKKKADT